MEVNPKNSMDTDNLRRLRPYVLQGRASEGFNGECNAQLEQLAEDGLLTAAGGASPVGPGPIVQTDRQGPRTGQETERKGRSVKRRA